LRPDGAIPLHVRLEHTRRACEDALREPDIVAASASIEKAGGIHRHVELVRETAASGRAPATLLALKQQMEADGVPAGRFPIERVLLIRCALERLDEVPAMAAVESVRHFWCKEVQFIARPPCEALTKFEATRDPFYAMCKIVTGRRYPAGHHCFERSGVPRSWLSKVPLRRVPRLLKFIVAESGGFAPFFETHLTSTLYQIPVLIEREFRMSFYRMAKSLEQQPDIRGLVGGSWLHSPETHRVNPHLAFMNRPFEEAGGFVIEIGAASEHDGFLAGSPARAELYRSGQYRPTHACAVCSREGALRWAASQDKIATLADAVR